MHKWESGARKLLLAQGAFYVATGLWPLVSIRSFEKVTGPKTDDWLVKTVGILIAVSGLTMVRAGAAARKGARLDGNVVTLAVAEALSLGTVSLVYSLKKRISRIYLLDSGVEFGIVYSWLGRRDYPKSA